MQNIISYDNKQLFHQQGKKNFAQFFDKSVFKRLSEKSGFCRRKARKITAYAFVIGFIECSLKKCCSYSQWALAIGRLTKSSISKQSLFERLNAGASEFARQLLQEAMNKQIARVRESALFGYFRKVILQDSTTLSLPDKLAGYFPGNVSGGIQKAVARIQCIVELKTLRFLQFTLSGFTQNDQSASRYVDVHINKRDLVIRDLGYFTLHSLISIASQKAYFLSRLRYGVKIYDGKGMVLSLKKLLRRNRPVDQWVWIGENQRLAVRLVMIPLPVARAAERKRRARKDRDQRLKHSQLYYHWLEYVVFVTNVNDSVWTTQQVAQAYKVRWQIEIIFKCWKSAFNLQYILQEQYRNEHRIITAILLMLLFVCLFIQKIYLQLKAEIQKRNSKIVSLFKLARYIAANLYFFFAGNRPKLREEIARHCCYERRSDRTNMADLIQFFQN